MQTTAHDEIAPMPEGLAYWTADEVAECLGYWQHLPEERARALYGWLWRTLSDASNPTPLGGDGTNGTVETPDGRLDLDNDDKAGHWWARLDPDWRDALVAAARDEGLA